MAKKIIKHVKVELNKNISNECCYDLSGSHETIAPDYINHRKRCREKFIKTPTYDCFLDYELLEFLLFFTHSRRDTKPIAKNLIKSFKSLDKIFCTPYDDLLKIDGLGQQTAFLIKLVNAIFQKITLNTINNNNFQYFDKNITVKAKSKESQNSFHDVINTDCESLKSKMLQDGLLQNTLLKNQMLQCKKLDILSRHKHEIQTIQNSNMRLDTVLSLLNAVDNDVGNNIDKGVDNDVNNDNEDKFVLQSNKLKSRVKRDIYVHVANAKFFDKNNATNCDENNVENFDKNNANFLDVNHNKKHITSIKSNQLNHVDNLNNTNEIQFSNGVNLNHSNVDEDVENPMLNSVVKVVNYYKLKIGYINQEHFCAIFLNNKNKFISEKTLQTGTINHASIYPREVVKCALDAGASGVIFIHNHPSGDIAPSLQDIEITKALKKILNNIDISVHDHIIISNDDFFSMKIFGII